MRDGETRTRMALLAITGSCLSSWKQPIVSYGISFFTSNARINSAALLTSVVSQRIETAFNGLGKSRQNGTNESFDGKFRDECLVME